MWKTCHLLLTVILPCATLPTMIKQGGTTMSTNVNTELMERAKDMLEYWTGTMHERIIQRDLDADDLEALKYHLDQAWKEMMLQENEYEASDVA